MSHLDHSRRQPRSCPRSLVGVSGHMIAGVIALFATIDQACGQAVLTPIPPLPGDNSVDCYALSADGLTVAGLSSTVGSGPYRAFSWRSTSGSVWLPGPAGGPTRNGDAPTDCSADGSVIVGGTTFNYPNGPYYTLADRWINGALSVLPDLEPLTYPNSYAHAVSGDGQTVTGFSLASGIARPVRWVGSGAAQDLGFPAGHSYVYTSDLTHDGSMIVGYARPSASADQSTQRAFTWTQAGSWQQLPSLPGYVGAACGAVTPDGTCIVGASYNAPSNPNSTRATRWVAGVPQDLGALPGDVISSAGFVSADGQMILCSSGSFDSSRFGVWTPSTGMLDLFEVLAGQGVDLSAYNPSFVFLRGLSADKHTLLMAAFNGSGGLDSFLIQNFGPPCLPSITSHPADATLCPGQPVQLTFAAQGSGPVSGSWKIAIDQQQLAIVNGVNSFPASGLTFSASGATTTTLSISLISLGSHTGPLIIRGRANDTCGGVNTLPAAVTVASFAVTQHPQSVQLCPADSATFNVGTASNFSTQWQWQVQDAAAPGGWRNLVNGASGDAVFSGVQSSSLHVAPVSSFLPGGSSTYRCLITHACGTTPSDPASLTVHQSVAQITQHPQPVVITPETQSAVLHAGASGPTPPTYRWECRYPAGSGSWLAFGNGNFYSPFENYWFNAQDADSADLTITPDFSGIPPEQWAIEFRCIARSTCNGEPSLPALVSILRQCGMADVAGLGGSPGWDGQLTVDDLVYFLAQFFGNNAAVVDIVGQGGTPGPDEQITVDDLIAFLSAFFSPCP